MGFFGALGFYNPNQLDLMTLIAKNPRSSLAAIRLNNVFQFTFPILVYITSIPVSMIIVRLNLQSSGLLGKGKGFSLAPLYCSCCLTVCFPPMILSRLVWLLRCSLSLDHLHSVSNWYLAKYLCKLDIFDFSNTLQLYYAIHDLHFYSQAQSG